MVYTSPSKVARIVELKNLGQSDHEIATQFNLHRTTIGRIMSRYEESNDPYYRRPKSGRRRLVSERDARHAALLLARTEAANVTELVKMAFPEISRLTMSRALHEYGLISRVRRTKPYISKANQIRRKDWADDHEAWTADDWKLVIFSDESKFNLFKSDGRQYAWFRPGQALDPRFTKKTVKHGGGSIMVWGCVTGEGMGRLHRIEGIMDGPGYVDILNKNLLGTIKDYKFKKTGKGKIIFQQDNDPKHTSRVAKDWFQKKKITVLPWAPSSPDMNIIEHVWDQIDRLIRARDPLPRNKDEMWAALQEEWYNFPKASLDKLYESMPRRVAALKAARGSHTKY
ncbi:putative DDE superfamily endonuclease [Lyophyllum shimeji]|uniref:DDE superfamily endonuclease n=1 Tax=Lyophyllum shimeji TaxID=47721 RepID=A0A9P3PPX5_LYOSH|nr:putative DDE superfamily endonuclease [Lyophyllum shimeji]